MQEYYHSSKRYTYVSVDTIFKVLYFQLTRCSLNKLPYLVSDGCIAKILAMGLRLDWSTARFFNLADRSTGPAVKFVKSEQQTVRRIC